MSRLGRTLAERARSLRGARGLAVALGAAVVLVVLLVVLIPGGGDGEPVPPPEDEAAAQDDGAGAQSAVARALQDMTIEEKVGQLMAVGPAGTGPGDPAFQALERIGYGALVLEARNYQSPGQIEGLADAARAAARREGQVEPWVMAPQEGGPFSALADLPPEKPPAEIGTPKDAAEAARRTAQELLDIGVTGILAPVLDVAGETGVIGKRAYSDREDDVRRYAEATVKAFEGAGIFAAAKHFPGLGAAAQSTEEGPTNVGLTPEQLRARDLIPFEAAVEAGVPGVVIGHGIYSLGDFVTPASLSPEVATDLLRGELRFRGVAIADDLTSPAITATLAPPDAAVDAVNAGIDMVYVGGDETAHRAVYAALLRAARAGDIDADRIDEAVERVLVAKRAAGLLEEESGRDGKAGARGEQPDGS